MKNRIFSKENIIPVCLLLIAFSFAVFFCCQKSGLFVDELITIGQANSSKGGWIGEIRDEYADGNMFGHTLTSQEIFDYLTVDESERFDIVSSYKNLSTDCHPPLYPILLKIITSFSVNTFSKWPGLILNLILFLLNIFLVFRLCHKLLDNGIAAALTMLLYALSPSVLTSVTFIRMYILLSFLTLLLISEIMQILGKPHPAVYPAITITILMGMMTQYIYVFAAFFLCLFTLVILLKRKEIKAAVLFSISALAGVALLFPCFPAIFKQFSVKIDDDQVLVEKVAMGNFSNASSIPSVIISNLQKLFNDSLPAVEIMLITGCVCLITVVFLKYRESNKGKSYDKFKLPEGGNAKTMLIVLGADLILTFLAVSLIANATVQRYFYNLQALLYPFVCLLFCMAAHYFAQIGKKITTAGAAVLLAAVLTFSMFAVKIRPLEFMYPDYPGYMDSLSSYDHCPCIYISSDKYKMIDESALQFLIRSDDVFITNVSGLKSDELKKYIGSHADNRKVLVYYFDLVDEEDGINATIEELFGYENSKLLFKDVRTPCYILE